MTTLTYDTDGYLTEVDGPLSGTNDKTTFTYDGYGRLYTVTDSESYTLTYSYDLMDRVTQVTYPDGTSDQTKYSRLDAVLFKDRIGRWTQRSYDSMDQLAFEIDPLGRKTQYTWCSCGALAKLTDPAGNITSWSHDIQGRVTLKTYADSSTVSYAYENTISRLASTTDALNQTTNYSYNLDNTLAQTSYTNAVNSTSTVTVTYDQNFPRISTVANGWGTITYSYNDYITDPSDPPITGGGRLDSVTNSVIANSGAVFTYDALGRTTNRSINGSANSTTWTYDAMSRITAEANSLGSFAYAYIDNTSGSSKGTLRLSSITYPNSQVTNFSYYNNAGDQRLQEIKNLNPSSAVLSQFNYAYNPAGEITSWQQQQNGRNSYQALQYDLAGQLTASLAGAGRVGPPYAEQSRYTYDLASNRTAVQTDRIEQARISGTVTASDVLTITVKDSALSGGQKNITYTVQSGDTLANIATGLALAITTDSDMQGLGVNGVASGSLLSMRSVSPNITTFAQSVSSGATETVTLGGVLNGTTNLAVGGTVTASDVLTLTVHDTGLTGGLKNVAHTVQSGDTVNSIASSIASAVNSDTDLQGIGVTASAASSVVSVRSSSNNATTYTTSTSSGATETLTLTPCANGFQTAVIGGTVTASDVLTITVYDGRLTSGQQAVNYTVQSGDTLAMIATGVAAAINGNSNLGAVGVTAQANSTIVNLASNSLDMTTYSQSISGGATETITLSKDIGITRAAFNNVNELTGLDPGGLVSMEGTTNKAVKSVTINGSPAMLNWSKSFTGPALLNSGNNTASVQGTDGGDNTKTNTYKLSATGTPNTALSYDANGNMTSDGTNSYAWDAEDRLIQITYPGSGNNTQCAYDGLGRSVKIEERTSGSVTSTKQFVWCGSARSEERDGSGNVTRQFVGLGEHVGGADCFYSKDHQGSVREMTNGSGVMQAQYGYDAYGRVTLIQGSNLSDYQYVGYYFHQRSGLSLTRTRAYKASLSRWTSRDPVEERGGVNLYANVENNPINLRDPFGVCPPPDIRPVRRMTPADMAFIDQGGFGNPQAAAVDVLRGANPPSIAEDLEYGGLIYRDPGTGLYFATTPISGERDRFNLLSVGSPPDSQLVGDYHTHGRGTGFEEFSGADKWSSAMRLNSIPGYQSYLATPNGQIRQYNPLTNKTTTIGRTR